MLALLLSWPVIGLSMAALASIRTSGPGRPRGGGRTYWIVIPALNEAKVIEATVTAALELHSPDTPVRVLVVDDGSDDETPELLRRLQQPRLRVIRREYPEARTGKGSVLNAGYRAIRSWAIAEDAADSTVVGVIDADGRGAPGMLRDTVDAFFTDPRVGAVQCRVRIKNRVRILGLLQDIEFSCVANASQVFRDLIDSVGLGGNGQFVRLGELMRFGDAPWSACLVEDLELGLRLHLAGVRVRYTPAGVVTQQAVVDIRRLLRQRARWAQGNLQCARHLRGLSQSRAVRSLGLLDYLAYLIPPWLAAPMSIIVLGVILLVVLGLSTGNPMGGLIATGPAVPGAVGAWIAVIFLPGLTWGLWHRWKIGDEPLWRCLVAGFCYPIFLMLGVIATWLGLARHLRGRRNWIKTERLAETPDGTPGPVAASR
jgi:cellulose synthase/poly-beta-1,6-N-acetylglucosamine synthase-like glycosyltransferase